MISLRLLSVLCIAPLTAVASAEEIDTRNYIYIEATGTVTAPPDHATVDVSVSHKGETPEAAVAASIKATDELFTALTSMGLPRSDIQTNNFVFEPVYIRAEGVEYYRLPDPDRDTFDGYRVRNSIRVSVKDLDRLGLILAGVARHGATISGVKFQSSDAPDHYARARDEAAANALAKAKAFAQATNVSLGTLLALREGGGYDPDTMEFTPVDGEADMLPVEIPIAPGTLNFSATVSTKWGVLPATE